MRIRVATSLTATIAILAMSIVGTGSKATVADKDFVEAGYVGVEISASFPEPFGVSTLIIRRTGDSRQHILFKSHIGEIEIGPAPDSTVELNSIPDIAFRCEDNKSCTKASSVLFVFEVGRPYINPVDSTDVISDTYSIEIFCDKRVQHSHTVTGDVLKGR